MRTIFTTNDIKNILKEIFDVNDTIELRDEQGNFIEEKSIKDYLNIDFYAWKNRLVEVDGSRVVTFEEWLESMQYSLDYSLGLVEITDSTVVPSQDLDSATLSGTLTFLIQSNKLNVLDYLVSRLRNAYLGKPQTITTYDGKKLTAYYGIGILLYDEEPNDTNFGETCIVSLNFSVTYINSAFNYEDTKIEFSLDDSTYDDEVPIIKATFQDIAIGDSVPKAERPDLTGNITKSWTQVATFSFYDFNENAFLKALNKQFWKISAISINNVATTTQEINIPIYVKITSDDDVYKYKYKLDNLEKVISNGDFNISSMTLKTWGKD